MLSKYKKNTLLSINAMKDKGTLLFPTNLTQIEDFKKAINSTQTLEEYIKVYSTINISAFSLFYNGVSPIKSKPEKNLGFKFDDTGSEWYFMYGKTKSYSFTYIIFRIGTNVLDKNECLYSITGGFGIGSNWVSFPYNVGEGVYKTDNNTISFSYTSKDLKTTFNINKNNLSIGATIIIDSVDTIKFNLTPQNPMQWNGKNGCVPTCFGNLGGIYSSFTNCLCSITYKPTTSSVSIKEDNGLGWFDHQSIIEGLPHGKIQKLVYSFVEGNKNLQQLRWIFLTLQLPDVQYSFSHTLSNNDIPLKINSKFTVSAVKHTKDGVEYNKTAKITIKNVKDHNNYTFPIEYLINIDNRNFTLKSVPALGIVILPTGITNWEAPADVSENGKLIDNSIGFLEANNLLSPSASNFIEYKLLTNNYLLLLIILLILILILIITTYLSIKYYPKKHKTLLSIITFIITFIVTFLVLFNIFI